MVIAELSSQVAIITLVFTKIIKEMEEVSLCIPMERYRKEYSKITNLLGNEYLRN